LCLRRVPDAGKQPEQFDAADEGHSLKGALEVLMSKHEIVGDVRGIGLMRRSAIHVARVIIVLVR
jgi:hypothetical protein